MTPHPVVTALVVSPNPVDAELAVSFLGQHGVAARGFGTLNGLADAVDETTGCVVIVEDALGAEAIPALREALARLPAWCDLPLVVVGSDMGRLGATVARGFPDSGNVTLLERPLNPHTLASAVSVAMRATARQREVGDLLTQREQAVRLRDEFLAMLAHELRNPLAPMRNAAHVMRIERGDDPVVQKNVEILERQVTHVVRLVDDLMDVARLERGKVVLQKERIDLNRVVASAVDACLPDAQRRGHKVSVRFDSQALEVDGDAVRLEQVISNLVNNASKYTPEPAEIVVRASAEGGHALVSVQDRGIGFDPATVGSLFDPYVQVNPTLARSAGGLGMGLTIVKRLVELHGGSVRALSEGHGKGALFEVRVPRAAGSRDPASKLAPEAVSPPVRRSVVVVDDNPDIRETMQVLLRLWGHDVEAAADGPSGLQLVLSKRPDFALIDVGLPGLSGYDVAREIRKALPDGVRLIALTGYGQPSDRELAVSSGFHEHLLKPVDPRTLKRLLAGSSPAAELLPAKSR